MAYTFCGTPKYMAPEILRKEPYDFPVDIWAWGVLMFIMSERCSPFNGRSQRELFQSIKWDEPSFRHTQNMGRDLTNLLVNVFNKEPNCRFGINDILGDKYFRKMGWDYVAFEQRQYWGLG